MKVPFRVLTPFKGTAAITGTECVFEPGDEVACELAQYGEVVAIEAHGMFYHVKRSDLDDCCISNSLDAPFYPD